MSSCGISLNLSSLESKITAHFSAVIGISGMAGFRFMTTALLVGLALSRGNFLAAIQIAVPAKALDGLWKGMRSEFSKAFGMADVPANIGEMQSKMAAAVGANSFDEIGVSGSFVHPDMMSDPALAGSWGGTDTFLGKLGEIGKDFYSGVKKFGKTTGLDQLSGYVDINVTDLAKTAIGLGGSWDSCNFGTGGIQNFFKDPSTGTIKLLANYAPKLGDTNVANPNGTWGMTAAVNSLFQSGKVSVQTQLQAVVGNVVTSGVPILYNKMGFTDPINQNDLANVRQFIESSLFSVSDLQKLAPGSSASLADPTMPIGSYYLASEETRIEDLKQKIKGRYFANDVDTRDLNVMNDVKNSEFFNITATVNL